MRKNLIFLALLSITSTCFAQPRLSQQIGDLRTATPIPHGMEFSTQNAFIQLTAYGPNSLRIRVTKTTPPTDFSYAIDDLSSSYNFKSSTKEGNNTILLTDSLKIIVNPSPFRLSFYNWKGELLTADDPGLGISWWGNQVSCYRKLHRDEKFIGLGEKTGGINRRGQFYQNWNSDNPAYGLNQDPLYATTPFFIGIHDQVCYGTFFDNTHHSYFNFGGGADEELYHFGADDGEMNYYFFGGPSVPQIIQQYTALTGRTPMPPIWSLGFQQCRWGYANSNVLLDIAKNLRTNRIPADVVYMDITYMDHYKVFTWDPVNFPDPKGMISELNKMNFNLVTIIDPGIKIEKGYKAYDEGVAGNHFAKYPGGHLYTGSVWPGRCHFPDFTKAATRKWWGNNFKASHVDMGVKGFWNDMNEPAAWGREFPNLIEFGEVPDKATLYTVKNAYGLLMARSTYEGTRALMNGQRPFVLTRASYSGIQKFSAQWTGDNFASDDHMLLGQRLLNSMGVSGIPFTGMDVAGFMGDASAELYVRWMNLAIYSPLFRNHSEINSRSHEPWTYGEANTRFIRGLMEQRYKMMPYLYSTFYQAHTTGIPINRMLPINYTFDGNVYNDAFGNEFLFGDNMLVCPVDSKKTAAEVYLPSTGTRWYRFNGDDQYNGGHAYFVPSPLDNLPVFIKESAIIPMQSVVQSTREKGDGILYLHIWKGNTQNSFEYYEDDGNSFDYEKGAYYKRTISYLPQTNQLTFGKVDGKYQSKFNRIRLVLHGFENTHTITVNGKQVQLVKEGSTNAGESDYTSGAFIIEIGTN